MQVVMCQWEVVIQLLEFHNPRNTEIIINSGVIQYCCCDISITCAPQSIFDANNNNCAERCDIFFEVNLYDGNSELSSTSTIKGSIQESPPDSLYGYIFSFTLDNFPTLVSFAKVCIINMLENACTCFLFITAQLSVRIEMREQNTGSTGSNLIDEFQLTANSSNCNKALQLDGDLGLASILLKFGLSCTDISACHIITNTFLAGCSKTSTMHGNHYRL